MGSGLSCSWVFKSIKSLLCIRVGDYSQSHNSYVFTLGFLTTQITPSIHIGVSSQSNHFYVFTSGFLANQITPSFHIKFLANQITPSIHIMVSSQSNHSYVSTHHTFVKAGLKNFCVLLWLTVSAARHLCINFDFWSFKDSGPLYPKYV